MTLDWAARWSKLHQFLYAGAPICPCTSPIESSHIDSTARSGKFAHGRNKQDFPQAPTYLRWLASRPACRAHSVDAAFADPAKPTPFWGGGGYFLFYCPVSATTVGLPRKGEFRTPPRCIVAGGHRAMLGAGVGGGVIRWLLLRWLSGLQ